MDLGKVCRKRFLGITAINEFLTMSAIMVPSQRVHRQSAPIYPEWNKS
jgi:hypothetical protein